MSSESQTAVVGLDEKLHSPAAPRIAWLAVALCILAVLFAAGAMAALVVSWNLSAADRAELAALEKVDCVILQAGVKTTFLPSAPAGGAPAGVLTGDWEYVPQILVRYAVDGEPVEQWLSIAEPFEAPDHWRAQEMLGRYRVGDELTVWHAAGDPSELLLKPGLGGRQTLFGGRLVAGFLALPAFGLTLAAILLWQVLRRQPAEPEAGPSPLAGNPPPTAARESSDS